MKFYYKYILLLFLLITFFFGTQPALLKADEVPIAFKGEVVKWDDEKSIISIEKGEVTYKDIRISADYMQLNRDTNEVVANGNVKMWNVDGNVFADSMRFDLDTEKGVFNQAKSEFQDKEIKELNGKLYLGGDQVEYKSDKTIINNATISTCSFNDQDYHLEAKEAEYYPEDKIVMRRVTYRQGKTPIMYWPALTVSLKDKNEDLMPEFGYKESDGYYVNFKYPYYLRPQSTGYLRLDYFSKTGFAGGVDHYELFPWGGYAKLSYYLRNYKYGIPASKTMNVNFFAPNYALGGWSINFDSNYNSTGTVASPRDYVETNLSINNDVSKYRTSIKIKQRNDITPTRSNNLTLDVDESFTLGKNINTQVSLDYNSGLHGKDISKGPNYSINFSQYESLYYWNLALSKMVYNSSGSDLYRIYTLPQFSISNSRAIFPKGFPLYTTFSHQTTYNELTKESVTHWSSNNRYTSPKTLKPYINGDVTYGGNYIYDYLGNANRTHTLDTWGQLVHNYTNEIRLTNKFTHHQIWTTTREGISSKSQPSDDLSTNFSANKQRWNLSVDSGYYFTSKRYKDLSSSYRYQPNYKLSIGSSGNYNLNEGKLNSLSGWLEYHPRDKWLFTLSTSYSGTANQLSDVSAKADVQLNEAWRIEYQKQYNLLNGTPTRGSLTVTRDLHCQELKFTFDELQKKATLVFSIKALPSYDLKLDASENGVSLDPTIITNIMNTGNQ